jgi:multiple sugar transport system permease protein
LALVSLILMSFVSGQGASIILICASMGSIPTQLYEAATIDGCGRWRQFFRITMPLVKPTLLYLTIINTVHSFQVFTQIYMMTGGGPFYATTTVVHQIYANAFQLYDYGKASVEGVFLLGVLLVLSFIQNRTLGSDVEY